MCRSATEILKLDIGHHATNPYFPWHEQLGTCRTGSTAVTAGVAMVKTATSPIENSLGFIAHPFETKLG